MFLLSGLQVASLILSGFTLGYSVAQFIYFMWG